MRRVGILAASAVLAIAAYAHADVTHGDMTLSTAAILGPGGSSGGTLAGPGLYSTGFEAPEYTAGNVIGGEGVPPWTMWTGTTPTVGDTNPFAGRQHLAFRYDSGKGTGGFRNAGFSPNLGALPPGDVSMSIEIFMADQGTGDYYINPQSPSQGFTTARVLFSDAGDIFVLDSGFQDTGADYVVGRYANLAIQLTGAGTGLDYFYDGNLIYSGGLVGGTNMEQVVLLSSNAQSSLTDMDDLNIIPEPASLLLLGLGGLALIRRR